MKPYQTLVMIALALGTSLHAAPEGRKQERRPAPPANSSTRQLEQSFDAIAKALSDARKQVGQAISQRDIALKALEASKSSSARLLKENADQLAAEKKAHQQTKQELAALQKQQKEAAAAKSANAAELADLRQKLTKANQALTVQLKTISDTRKEADNSAKKLSEAEKALKARDAEKGKLRDGRKQKGN